MKDPKNILFGYSCTPAYGCFYEDDGGFSLQIDRYGVLIYKTYLFDCIEQTQSTFQLSQKTISEIKRVLKKYSRKVKKLSENLYNDSDDGECNEFIFSGKRITSWNIEYTNICLLPLVLILDPVYFVKYGKSILQENIVLCIFKLITKQLKNESITLTLHKIIFDSEQKKDL